MERTTSYKAFLAIRTNVKNLSQWATINISSTSSSCCLFGHLQFNKDVHNNITKDMTQDMTQRVKAEVKITYGE